MLSLAFFVLGVVTAGTGFLLLPAGMQQIAAFAVAALFLVLALLGIGRKSNRPWRTRPR